MLVEYDIEKAIIDLVLAFVLFISVNRSAVFYIAKYHNTLGIFREILNMEYQIFWLEYCFQ